MKRVTVTYIPFLAKSVTNIKQLALAEMEKEKIEVRNIVRLYASKKVFDLNPT